MNQEVQNRETKDNEDLAVVKHELYFAGPLPHPAVLEQYERVVPGSAQKIITMTEEQSRHRRQLESKVVESDIKNSRLGLICGFIIGVLGIAIGAVLALQGKERVSGVFSIGTLASLVAVFIYGSRARRKEREGRDNE